MLEHISDVEKRYWEVSMGFPITPNNCPHSEGQKHERIAKKLDFPFSNYKLCYEVFPISNFQQQNCSYIS